MKKLLLALPILAFPLVAQAADKPTQASEVMIQATEKRFLQNYCAKGIERLAADVYDCFQQTKSSDSKQEECLIADMMVIGTIKKANNRAIALGQTPQYNMPFFTSIEAAKRSRSFMDNHSKFKDYTMLEFANYLAKSVIIIIDDNNKLFDKTNGNCSAYFKP